MKTSVHFVAMPLAYPLHPSSQLGYLHGFTRTKFKRNLEVKSHHAFLPILYRAFGLDMGQFFARYSLVGEEILFLCNALSAREHGETERLLLPEYELSFERYHRYAEDPGNDSQQFLFPIRHDEIFALTKAIEHHVEHRLLPALDPEALNVIGYTASFCQVFGSILAARHLSRLGAPRHVNLFGGSSFTLPEGRRTLAAWGVDGLIVKGTGETSLTHLLAEALEAPEHVDDDVLRNRLACAGGKNVSCVREEHGKIDLTHSQKLLDTLPDPDFDGYFNELRLLCEDDKTYSTLCREYVSLPVEGSRGCFAKCDFCHNPNITADFRSLTGVQVARRALRLAERYAVGDITFVDSVCNTWAEGYADYLIERGIYLPSFLELRVHEPEEFWTKMAVCGATRLQLGIEAIGGGLLRSMKKGTRVSQNLAATKFMSEMGIRDASNLIIHHPRSTVEDVLETIRIMRVCEHFPIFNLSRFVLSFASPLYNELEEERKSQLSRGFDWLPVTQADYGWPRHLSYTWPNAWTDPDVTEAWLAFQDWYGCHVKDVAAREKPPRLDIIKDAPDVAIIHDTRRGTERWIEVRGLDRLVLEACHQPRKLWHLCRGIDASEDALRSALMRLEDKEIVLRVQEDHLTVALRVREGRQNGIRKQVDTPSEALAVQTVNS